MVLSRLILEFVDGGIQSSHCVLQNSDSLRAYREPYVLNESEFAKAARLIEETRFIIEDDLLTIRTVTLSGWMHTKRNLGVEHIRIARPGGVKLDTRQVLSEKIFKSVPEIRY